MRDLSPVTCRALARKVIVILGPVAIPDMTSVMPWANAERGYAVDDNGCHRIWKHHEVVQAAH